MGWEVCKGEGKEREGEGKGREGEGRRGKERQNYNTGISGG
jgi:hypothetical protein